jgi:hypothetical protein
MEYFVGAIVTFIAIITIRKMVDRSYEKNSFMKISYSQSNVLELLYPLLPEKIIEVGPPTQASKYYDEVFTKIMIVDNYAYWIKNNTFYSARVVDGEIDKETAKPVDTIGMDKVQLDKMIFIVETLTKGNFDDYRNSR